VGGTVKVSEDLENKKLDFKKDKSGLYFSIDNEEIFNFSLEDYKYFDKGFSLAYHRETPDGKFLFLDGLGDPYDKEHPEPKNSILRQVFDSHLTEITFEGRVDLKFHSWWEKPHTAYWTIDKPRNKNN